MHFPFDFLFVTNKREDPHIWAAEEAEVNSPRSIYQNSNMTPRLSGHFLFIWFGFLFKSLLGIGHLH